MKTLISYKDEVNISGLSTEMRRALGLIAVGWTITFPEDHDGLTITSAQDGKHMEKSKHYQGDAIDVRVFDVGNDTANTKFVPLIRVILGKDFDVIFEQDHIHIEYDPKA